MDFGEIKRSGEFVFTPANRHCTAYTIYWRGHWVGQCGPRSFVRLYEYTPAETRECLHWIAKRFDVDPKRIQILGPIPKATNGRSRKSTGYRTNAKREAGYRSPVKVYR